MVPRRVNGMRADEMNSPERIGRSLGYESGYSGVPVDKMPRGVDPESWRAGYDAAVRDASGVRGAEVLAELDELDSLLDRT